jgi:hypothetical protein
VTRTEDKHPFEEEPVDISDMWRILAHRLLGRCETLAKQVNELQEKLQAAEHEVVRLTKALQVADHQLAYFLGERDL